MQSRRVSNSKVALVWAALGALATAAVLPYVFALLPMAATKVPLPLSVVAAIQLGQATALVFFLSWVGLICGTRVGLDSSVVRSWLGSHTLTIAPRRLVAGTFPGRGASLGILSAF